MWPTGNCPLMTFFIFQPPSAPEDLVDSPLGDGRAAWKWNSGSQVWVRFPQGTLEILALTKASFCSYGVWAFTLSASGLSLEPGPSDAS